MTTQGTSVPTGSDRGSEVKGAVAEESGQVAQTAKDSAQQVASEAKNQARNLTGELRTQVNEQAGTQRDRLVGLLREISDELREMAEGGNRDGVASELARQAGDRVRGLGDYLDGRQAGDLLDEVRDFARRRPGTFLLGAAAAGVLTGRLTRGVKEATSGGGSSAGGPQRYAVTGGTSYADPYDDPYAAPVTSGTATYPATATTTYPPEAVPGTAEGAPLAGTTAGAWGESGDRVGDSGADTAMDPLSGTEPRYGEEATSGRDRL